MRGKNLFDWLTTLMIIIITIDVLLSWRDRALAQRMRDVEAADKAAGSGHIGADDVDLEDVIASRGRT